MAVSGFFASFVSKAFSTSSGSSLFSSFGLGGNFKTRNFSSLNAVLSVVVHPVENCGLSALA